MPGGRPRRAPKPTRRRRGSGSVAVRRDGRIAAYLPPDLDPERRARYGPGNRTAFHSRAEAETWLAIEVARLRSPPPTGAHRDELLGDYVERWLRTHGPTMSPRTLLAYTNGLALLMPYLGDVLLRDLTHDVIQGALAALQVATWQYHQRDGTPIGVPRPYAPSTIAHARAVLRAALQTAVPDVLPHNPVSRTKLSREQGEAQPCWDADEAERFLTVARAQVPHLALAYRLILWRGLRKGEVLALKWVDVDERRKLLIVDETAGKLTGTVGPTKGRKLREIPLSDALLGEIRAHRLAQPAPSVWVFSNPQTGKPWNINVLSDWLPKLAREAGLRPITPKDLRATCATVLLDQGVSLPRVSQLLGHANVATTAQFYARALEARASRIARVADELDAAHERALAATRAAEPTPLRSADVAE